jgi:metacaspase-1
MNAESYPLGLVRRLGVATGVAGLLVVTVLPAQAASHALLMWIASYAEPSAKLNGIKYDAERARQMAAQLGVPPANIVERRDEQLSFAGMRAALAELAARVRPGDRVFIYFSGHGARYARAGAPGCQEGLVTHEGRLMLDVLLRGELERLAVNASQVVMFTDACHAGGMVSKGLNPGGDDAVQTKAYPLELIDDVDQSKSAVPERAEPCSVQVNLPKSLPGRGVFSSDPSQRIFHLAAAAEDEAAFATPQGSVATQAWAACLSARLAATGDALARCAQNWIAELRPSRRQTVTPTLNSQMPLLGESR